IPRRSRISRAGVSRAVGGSERAARERAAADRGDAERPGVALCGGSRGQRRRGGDERPGRPQAAQDGTRRIRKKVESRRKLDAAGRAAIGLLALAIGCAASASDDFQRGTELARSGRWEEARAAFLEGERQAPRDQRFPLELAGVEYRRKNFAAAKRELRRALKLDSGDRYGNDFLGTLYYLEGNLEAALGYWNRIAKPQIDDVKIEPEPRANPVLLDSTL